MSLPYFPMFPTDFEAKTSHLTLEEDGAYNRLLRLMWMTPGCSLPDDDAWIARRMRVDAETYERVVRVVIDEFCERENGRVSNARIAREYASAVDAHERRVSAGSKGGMAKALKTKRAKPSNALAKPWQPEPEPEPYIERGKPLSGARAERVGPFSEFWEVYPHRGGARKGKAQAFKRWATAIKAGADPADILAAARRYHADAQVRRGFAKDPATWLNQRCWEDETEPDTPPPPSGPPRESYGEEAARLIRQERDAAAKAGRDLLNMLGGAEIIPIAAGARS